MGARARSENFQFVNIPGKSPEAVFVDAEGSVLERVDLAKMKTDEIVGLLESHGFRRKPAPAAEEPAEAAPAKEEL